MKLRILGCYGGQLPGKHMTSFLLDDTMLIDAGGATASLSIEEQRAIEYILVSHAHLDHVKDIPFIADNIIGSKDHPIPIVAAEAVIEMIRNNLLNNELWPDFTVIPTKEAPVLRWHASPANEPFEVGPYTIEFVRVNHPVPTYGMFISKAGKTLLYTADTGPTDEIWARARAYGDLKAVIAETSFPNSMVELSLVSGHLSPCHLEDELAKLGRSDVPIYLYHFKPAFEKTLNEEVAALKNSRIIPFTQGETISI